MSLQDVTVMFEVCVHKRFLADAHSVSNSVEFGESSGSSLKALAKQFFPCPAIQVPSKPWPGPGTPVRKQGYYSSPVQVHDLAQYIDKMCNSLDSVKPRFSFDLESHKLAFIAVKLVKIMRRDIEALA